MSSVTNQANKKLGLLISARPAHPNFERGIELALEAIHAGVGVYLYLIDNAVEGMSAPRLRELQKRGGHIFACAHAARRRDLELRGEIVFAGLGQLSEIIAHTDRFVTFDE